MQRMHIEDECTTRKNIFARLIAKLSDKALALVSPYFGEANFAFASVRA